MKIKSVLILFTAILSLSNHFSFSFNNKNNQNDITHTTISDEDIEELFDTFYEYDIPTFIENKYAVEYFNNLESNFGNNTYGTCNYVAIGMLLSFYDSYWKDSFVDDTYDANATYITQTDSTISQELLPYGYESPGILFEPDNLVSNLTFEQYQQVIEQYSNQYFHLKLLSLGKQYFGNLILDNNDFGMNHSQLQSFLNYYLYTILGYDSYSVPIRTNNTNHNSIKNYVINKVQAGIPVILRATQNGDNGHSFIAYDYDAINDEIYVHTGWRNEAIDETITHISIDDLGYNTYLDATTIEPNIAHTHCENYIGSNGQTKCSCNYILPHDVEITSGNYRDTNPTYSWDSMFKEKWLASLSPYMEVYVYNNDDQLVYSKQYMTSTTFSIPYDIWQQIIFHYSATYYIKFKLMSMTNIDLSYYEFTKRIPKPSEYQTLPTINPDEYGFEDAYPIDDETKTHFIEHTTSSGFKFSTRRYRTGYIHNEYIVMSPKRVGITEAYIEYSFTKEIDRIDVELSHWRDYTSEQLNADNGTAVIQEYVNGTWVTKVDLLSTEANLPTNRNAQKLFNVVFSDNVYRFRFYSSTIDSSHTNDNNKGRICIGKMAFYIDEQSPAILPISGYELDYEPDRWNNNSQVWSKSNCYSYAVNAQRNPIEGEDVMLVGQSFGLSGITPGDYLKPSRIIGYIERDAEAYGFLFGSIEADQICPVGTYKVAIVADGDPANTDLHWYRQNSDGTWSHKLAREYVSNVDAVYSLIYNPENCERDYITYDDLLIGYNYRTFIGYFYVSPLNLYV